MIRARIIVKGKVQRVGYRDEVEDVATAFGINGFVRNLEEKDKVKKGLGEVRIEMKDVVAEVKGSREDIRAMHVDMSKRFDLTAKRYNVIAKRTGRWIENDARRVY